MNDSEKTSFFISYAAADRTWADWIARELENNGYSTFFDAKEIKPGGNFIHQVRQALAHCDQMIMLLTPRYLRSEFTTAEWSAAFARDPAGERGMLLPVRVENCDPGDLIGRMGFVDLVGLDEVAARDRLLRHIMQARAKASSPPISPNRGREPRVTPPFPELEPKIWNLPPRLELFTDREDALARLRERLAAEPQSGPNTLALTGCGGIGKTALAIEYAYRFRGDYKVGWIITADVPDRFAAGAAELGQALGLPDVQDKRALLDGLRQWLESTDSWLLIFDDADDPEILRPLLPSLTRGHILITSRNLQWSSVAQSIEVAELPRAASIYFLRERTQQDDNAGADKVASALQDLPLGLEMASAYCTRTGTSLTNYAEMLEQGYNGVEASVFSSADLWFSKLEKESPAAMQLLSLLAFFSDSFVTPELFVNHSGLMPEPLNSLMRDRGLFGAAIVQLEQTSLLRREGTNFVVHPLVQALLRERMDEGRRIELASAAVALLDSALPEFPFGAWDVAVAAAYDRLEQHARAAAAHAEALGASLDIVARLFA
ncbi:MAG: TIR domain-containing protein, partial [Bryobacteraceae bacterium]